jgi:hypothetical protein
VGLSVVGCGGGQLLDVGQFVALGGEEGEVLAITVRRCWRASSRSASLISEAGVRVGLLMVA